MKTKTVSKDWGRLIGKGMYTVHYKKGNADWMFEALGWKGHGRRTS